MMKQKNLACYLIFFISDQLGDEAFIINIMNKTRRLRDE